MYGTIISETRQYNNRLQLARLTSNGLDIEYRYSATQNNGRITRQKDWASGEEVAYTYDALLRLASAVTTDNPSVPQWDQSYSYDGFGNLSDQNVTKGSAPTLHVVYNISPKCSNSWSSTISCTLWGS